MFPGCPLGMPREPRQPCGISSSRSSCQQCVITHPCCSCSCGHTPGFNWSAIGYQPDFFLFFLPLGVREAREIIKSNAFNWRSQVFSKYCSIRLCYKLVIALSICSPGPWMSRQCPVGCSTTLWDRWIIEHNLYFIYQSCSTQFWNHFQLLSYFEKIFWTTSTNNFWAALFCTVFLSSLQ